MKKTTLFLFAAPLSWAALSANASEPVVLFADTFDDLSQWSSPSNNDELAGRIIEATDLNSEALFGEANNSYLRIFKGDNHSATNAMSGNSILSEPSPVITVAFDFWNSSSGAGQIVLRPGGTTSANLNRFHEIGFARGTMSGVSNVYAADQTQRVEIVLNNSAETVFYNDFYSVASDTFDVWIDGVRVLNDHTRSRGSLPVGEPLGSLQWAVFTTNWGELLVDDLTVYKGAHVTPVSNVPSPVFSDTFEDLSGWGAPTNQLAGFREIGVTSENSETYFGESNNNYLRFYKNDPEGNEASMLITAINVASSPVVTVTFDFWQDTTADLLTGLSFRAGQGTSVPNDHRVHNLTLRNGAINDQPGIYSPDAKNNIQIVYNNSENDVTYLAGARTLIADAIDVWVNGVLVLQDEQFSRGSLAVGEPLRSFQFVGFTADRTEIFVDNFEVYDMAFVQSDVTPPGLPKVRITDLQHNGTNFSLSFTTETGHDYTVEYTSDLAAGNWQPLETQAGTGEVVTVQDWSLDATPARFYRVSVSAVD